MTKTHVQSVIAMLLLGMVVAAFGISWLFDWGGGAPAGEAGRAATATQPAPQIIVVTVTTAQTEGAVPGVPQATHDLSQFSSNDAVSAHLSLREAEYWNPLPNHLVNCRLCPRLCVIPDGFRGKCNARVNIAGSLRTLVYGRVVAVHVDPIEKKPLFHFEPGSKAFSIATAGCNMDCLFCQNWEISQARPEEAQFTDMSPEDVVRNARQNGCGSIAYTYTEPTVFFEYMRDTSKRAREQGIKNVWITCGYIEEKPLRELCKYIDAANVDLKGFTERFYLQYTSGKMDPVLRTFKVLKEEGVWTELTNLVIPGANDSPQEISNLCAWVVSTIGTDMPVHFSRFHPNYKMLDRAPTPVATLEMAARIARAAGIKYVYIGNVAGGEYESTYCASCHKLLIERIGYMIRAIHIRNGTCEYCGTPVAGVWQ